MSFKYPSLNLNTLEGPAAAQPSTPNQPVLRHHIKVNLFRHDAVRTLILALQLHAILWLMSAPYSSEGFRDGSSWTLLFAIDFVTFISHVSGYSFNQASSSYIIQSTIIAFVIIMLLVTHLQLRRSRFSDDRLEETLDSMIDASASSKFSYPSWQKLYMLSLDLLYIPSLLCVLRSFVCVNILENSLTTNRALMVNATCFSGSHIGVIAFHLAVFGPFLVGLSIWMAQTIRTTCPNFHPHHHEQSLRASEFMAKLKLSSAYHRTWSILHASYTRSFLFQRIQQHLQSAALVIILFTLSPSFGSLEATASVSSNPLTSLDSGRSSVLQAAVVLCIISLSPLQQIFYGFRSVLPFALHRQPSTALMYRSVTMNRCNLLLQLSLCVGALVHLVQAQQPGAASDGETGRTQSALLLSLYISALVSFIAFVIYHIQSGLYLWSL